MKTILIKRSNEVNRYSRTQHFNNTNLKKVKFNKLSENNKCLLGLKELNEVMTKFTLYIICTHSSSTKNNNIQHTANNMAYKNKTYHYFNSLIW